MHEIATAANGILTVGVNAMATGSYVSGERKVGYPQILNAHIAKGIVYGLVEFTAREHRCYRVCEV